MKSDQLKTPAKALVSTRQITKHFSGVKALDGVDFWVNQGEVLGLVGENGAGKSTLMRILGGVYPHGSFGGSFSGPAGPARFHSPLDAERAGIAIIHQELSVFSHLTVAENIFMGHLPRRGPFVDWELMNKRASFWLKAVGAPCDPNERMDTLSVGTQQLVEIAKALSRESKILILDEPTSALSQRECEKLFKLVEELRSQNKGLIYISHKMDEVFRLCDRIVVLRDGKTVKEAATRDMDETTLITHMVGRTLSQQFPEKNSAIKTQDPLLVVDKLSVVDSAGRFRAKNISFELREGEILGLAGLMGSGRTEVLHGLYGAPGFRVQGKIGVFGKRMTIKSPRQALRSQIALILEDRKTQSIFPNRSLDENVSLTRLALRSLFSMIDQSEERRVNDQSFGRLRVKTSSPARTIETLSGGNQQKVILARMLQMNPRVILLDEPTRGVDVGAKYEIYEILFSLARSGHALLVVSSDLPELLGLCDRIGVLNEGELKAVFKREDFDSREIMRFAVGGP